MKDGLNPMPKFAANLTMMFNEVDFLDRFEAASKARFRGVEYLFPYDFNKDDIAERLEKFGMTQVLFDLPAGDWLDGGHTFINMYRNLRACLQIGRAKLPLSRKCQLFPKFRNGRSLALPFARSRFELEDWMVIDP